MVDLEIHRLSSSEAVFVARPEICLTGLDCAREPPFGLLLVNVSRET